MPRSFKPPNNLGEYFMRYTVYMRVEFVFFIIPNLWARSHRPPTQYNLHSTTDTTMYSDSLAAVSKIMRTWELLPEKLGVYSVWLIQAVNYRGGVPGLSHHYSTNVPTNVTEDRKAHPLVSNVKVHVWIHWICHQEVRQWFKLTLRRLMSYIYGAPILDVSRSHTTTQHSR